MEKALWILPVISLIVIVVYIILDQTRQKKNSQTEASEAELRAESSKFVHNLLYQINDIDVQNAFGSVIASLNFSAIHALMYPVKVVHTFPRDPYEDFHNRNKRETPPRLEVKDLDDAVKNYSKKLERPEKEVWKAVNNKFKTFDRTRSLLKGEILRKLPSLREGIKDIQHSYPFFNGDSSLHQSELEEICLGEKIEFYYIDKLPLLSFMAEYDEQSIRKRILVVRRDIHQCLKEFLIAHELGHWFLHIKTEYAQRINNGNRNYYLHSSPAWKPLEVDADAFAMVALFPAPLLASYDLRDELNAEALLNDFTLNMEKLSPSLRETMVDYINKRIARYTEFKDKAVPVNFNIDHLEGELLDALLTICKKSTTPVGWVITNDQKVVTDGNDYFFDLFDKPRNEIIDKLKTTDLVLESDRKKMEDLFEMRIKKQRNNFFYITNLKFAKKNSSRVVVKSYSILENGEYKGALGIMIPTDDVTYYSDFYIN